MTQTHTGTPPTAPADYPDRTSISEFFSSRAEDLDQGRADVRPGIRFLGERGLVDLGVPDNAGGRLAPMLLLVEDVAAGCMSSGFSLWAQRMVLEYLSRYSDRPHVAQELPDLRSGARVGASALAPAMKDAAGLEPVPILATRTADGVRLNGPIPWASNLFDDALIVVPARYDNGSGVVVFLNTGDPGVVVHKAPELLALGATASSSITLTDVDVPTTAILSADLPGFVRSIRPTLLLVQSAFCSGLARASREHAGDRITGLNAEFTSDFAELTRQHDSVRRRLFDFGRAPQRQTSADLLRLRLDAARVASAATRLESTVTGGGGYVATSATSRRLREAAFLPIQAPTEGQLRWELSQSG